MGKASATRGGDNSPGGSPRSPNSPNGSPRGGSPRGRQKGGVGETYIELVVAHNLLPKLRISLREGGGMTAARDVGNFREGMVLVAGGDLDLQAFDVIGLEPGDDIDRSLRGAVQEAIAALADDGNDAKLFVRPTWMKVEPEKKRRCVPRCCRRKKWKRRRRCMDQLRWVWVAIESTVFRLLYARSQSDKTHDMFISSGDAEKDVASWMKAFCENRAMTVYYEQPCIAAMVMKGGDILQSTESDSPAASARDAAGRDRSSESPDHAAVAVDPRNRPSSARISMASAVSSNMDRQTSSGSSPTPVHQVSEAAQHLTSTSDLPCKLWLQQRRSNVRAARVLLVVVSEDGLDNLMCILDCLWAWQAGVPILPIRRFGVKVNAKALRKQFPWAFKLGFGVPEAGRGAARQRLGVILSRALVRGLRLSRQARKRGNKLPKGIKDAFEKGCTRVQRDVDLLQEEAEVPPEEAYVELGNAPGEDNGEDAFTEAKRSSMSSGDSAGQSKEESKSEGHVPQQQEVVIKRLEAPLEERVYGIIALLALHAEELRRVSIIGVETLRRVSHHSSGSTSIAEFGGLETLLQLVLKSSMRFAGRREIASENAGSGRRRRAARWIPFGGGGSSPTGGSTPPSSSRRGSPGTASSPTGDSSPSQSPRHHHGAFGKLFAKFFDSDFETSDGGSSPSNSPRSGSPSQSPRHSPSGGKRTPGSDSPTEEDHGHGASAGRQGRLALAVRGATMPHGQDDICLAETCIAALRNSACRSAERKLALVQMGCVAGAVKSMSIFRGEEGEEARQAAAALLRNLSSGGHEGTARGLADGGLLAFAEEELSSDEASSVVRRHLLATVQNVAACVEERDAIFPEGSIETWMSICATAVKDAVRAKEPHVMNQALTTLANLALVRADETAAIAVAVDADSAGSSAASRLRLADIPENTEASRAEAAVLMAADEKSEKAEEEEAEAEAPPGWSDSEKESKETAEGSGWSGSSESSAEAAQSEKPAPKAQDSSGGWSKSSSSVSKNGGEDEGWDSSGSVATGDKKSGSTSTSSKSISSEGWGGDGSKKGSKSSDDAWGAEEKEPEEPKHYVPSEEGQVSEEDVWSVISVEESLPTEAKMLERSLALAEEKVPIFVLESMLNLLRQPEEQAGGSKRVSAVANAIAALCNFAQDVHVERSIGHLGGIELVLHRMAHSKRKEVHIQALRFLWNMSFSRTNQAKLLSGGALPQVCLLLAMRRDRGDVQIHEQGCGVLRNMATGTSAQRRALFKEGAVTVLCRSIARYPKERTVCMQASAALRLMCHQAIPVAEQAVDADGVSVLVIALNGVGEDFDLTDELLQTLETILLSPRALRPFCQTRGHQTLLEIIQRLHSHSTFMRAARVLATALSHRTSSIDREPDDHGSNSENNSTKSGSQGGRHSVASSSHSGAASAQSQLLGETRKDPTMLLRMDLHDEGVLKILCTIMDQCSSEIDVLEAVMAALLNLTVDVTGQHGNSGAKMTTKELKVDTGKLSKFFLKFADLWVFDEMRRPQAACFVSRMLTMFASLCIQPEAAIHLYRNGAGERVLEWMALYVDSREVQCNGCEFLRNFSAARYRVREAIVWAGGIEQLANLLEVHLKNKDVLEASMRALHNFVTGPNCVQECRDHKVIQKVMAVVVKHPVTEAIQESAFSLLWNITTTQDIASDMVHEGGVNRARIVLNSFSKNPQVIVPAVGLLRNMFASPSQCRNASEEYHEHRGYKQLLDLLWTSCLPTKEQKEAAIKRYGEDRIPPEVYATPASTKVAEQVFGALNNIAQIPRDHRDHLAWLTHELTSKDVCTSLRFVLQIHPKSTMAQYQGLSMIRQVLSHSMALKVNFAGFGHHVSEMLKKHQETPVSDAAELLLEEVA